VNDHLQLRVERTVAGGAGLARESSGRVVLVSGALPGELVEVEVVEARRDFARGRAVAVVEPAAGRVWRPCPYERQENGCGGCGWQHAAPALQTELRAQIVTDALARVRPRPVVPEWLPGTAVAPEGYRTTAHFAVGADGRLAYRRRGGGAIEIDACLVAHPLLAPAIAGGRFPGATSVSLRTSVADGDVVAVVAPRAAAAAAQVPSGVTVIGAEQPMPADPAGADRPEGHGEGRSEGRSGPPGGGRGGAFGRARRRDRPFARPAASLAPGVGAVTEEVAGRRWRVSAGAFFQSGPAAAQLIVDAVIEASRSSLLTPSSGDGGTEPMVIDLYAGVGLLGGAVVDRWAADGITGRLVAVESNPAAVADAGHNLADLDATVVQAQVGEPATRARLRSELDRVGRAAPDLVIADPARSGLGRPGVDTVAALGAPHVVLVSCDPASFAHDAALLAGQGYRARTARIIGAVVHTPHVEIVTAFEAAGPA
jgi:tRNA/tmRNA/rRNA uracil-C5-methylase (TrmA/RlmC/RlmD family)